VESILLGKLLQRCQCHRGNGFSDANVNVEDFMQLNKGPSKKIVFDHLTFKGFLQNRTNSKILHKFNKKVK
jgi:hypothetical protein